jgi:hypothetical protein
MMLTGLADVLRDAGLEVVETDGWKKRGHGEMTNVHGVTCHHNAGGRTTNAKAGLNTIINGRSDLPGPLAHIYLARNGVVYIVAAGLCYHAGVSRDNDYTNGHRIGIEAQAAGDGWSEDWPDVQMGAYALVCKALADHYDFSISQVKGHKETCAPVGRKSDPNFNMDDFRDSVREADVLTSTDKKWLEAKIRDVVLDVLKNEDIVPNLNQDKQNLGNMSVVAALRLGDFKEDRDNDKLDQILKLLSPPVATKAK